MPGPRYRDGDIVTLRTVEEEDVAFCQRLLNDPRVRSGLFSTGPITRTQEEEWVESVGEEDDVHLLACVDGNPVGVVGHHSPNDRWGTAEVGYMVAPDEWGNGYATDALRTLTADTFHERRLHKLYARVYATNPASQQVLEKVGFVEEGVFREEAFVGGEYVDVLRYGLLAEEFDG